jgi:hypothetical protein
LVLTRARIEVSISHGARDLRGRYAPAWSRDLERRFMRRQISGMMNDVHFVDGATAEVGLNDCVYTLKKR